MKHLLLMLVLGNCLEPICMSGVAAQDTTDSNARQVLVNYKPLVAPSIQVGAVNPQEQKIATRLFAAQIKALHELAGSTDASLIPILIPYLHYTNDNAPIEVATSKEGQRGTEDISLRYPAFSVIIHIPAAGGALNEYIDNAHNSLEYRLAAYHVLRYVDRKRFDKLRLNFDKEFSQSGSQTKSRLRAIEQGNAPFEGIDALDLSQ